MEPDGTGWTRYVAIGDSFTEGVGDPPRVPGGPWRGWADRVAERLAVGAPGLRYANLGVRGATLDQIVEQQVPAAVALDPDLVTVCAAGNDFLRPRVDPDALAARLEEGVRALRATGADVLVFTSYDPRRMRVMRLRRGRIAIYDMLVAALAQRHGVRIVDMWAMTVLTDPRARVDDRLHLSEEAHRRVALRVQEVLGLEVAQDWRVPWPSDAPRSWGERRRADLEFMRRHLGPWTSQRLRRHPPGLGRVAKRPHLSVLDEAADPERIRPEERSSP